MNNMRGTLKSTYQNIYKKAIVENDLRNGRIATMAQKFRDTDRKILILVNKSMDYFKIATF